MNLDDPVDVALATTDVLREKTIPHALYGGLALATYGEPRETRDVDLAAVHLDMTSVADALREAGWSLQQAFDAVVFGGLRISRITLLGRPDDSGLNVLDLVVPRDDRHADAAVSRALSAPLRGREITLLAPEDFLVSRSCRRASAI